MGRYIDADEITLITSNEINVDGITYIPLKDAISSILNCSTAFDKEKVDEQILEYFKEVIDKKPDGWDVVEFSNDVRDIVRAGGVENDMSISSKKKFDDLIEQLQERNEEKPERKFNNASLVI